MSSGSGTGTPAPTQPTGISLAFLIKRLQTAVPESNGVPEDYENWSKTP